MPKNLVFEIGTEEMPASCVDIALNQLKEEGRNLDFYRLSFDSLEAYGTPRRLALIVRGLAEEQKEEVIEVKGPPRKAAFTGNGEPTAAAIGFAKAQGVALSDLIVKENEQGEYVYAVKHIKGKKTKDVLPEYLSCLVKSINFPKTMRWGEGNLRFIRPIRWLLALYGDELIEFEIDGLKTSRFTYGHRFLAPGPWEVLTANDYLKVLEKSKVIIDQGERRKMIVDELNMVTKDIGKALIHLDVINEVVNLVEYPHAILGSFPPSYVQLPREIPITVMESHQRYFPVEDDKGELLPYFIIIQNGDPSSSDLIREGNERVIRARLADSQFFYQEDQKIPLEKRVENLKDVVFQQKLGNLYEKTLRTIELVREISQFLGLPPDIISTAERAAYLAKADLLTEMVFEFPELQGVMGREYALLSGELKTVAQAIFEHYLPRFPGDELPSSLPGQLVSIADKIDTIVGYFLVGLIPSGSEDPFSLRRQGQGVISIIFDKELAFPFEETLRISLSLYRKIEGLREEEETFQDLIDFFKARARRYFSKKEVNYDIIEAVLFDKINNLVSIKRKVEAIVKFHPQPQFEDLLIAFTRCHNLSSPELGDAVNSEKLIEKEEKDFYSALVQAEEKAKPFFENDEFLSILKIMAGLKPTIDLFFDKILVMSEDEELRKNRLSLLNKAVTFFKKVADFSKIVF